jgi:cysteine desulfurase
MLGGGQERGVRSGTENVPYIVGLGTACALAEWRLKAYGSRLAALRDRLEHALVRLGRVWVNGRQDERLPNTSNLSFDGIRASHLVRRLDEAGVCVSPGSACHAGEDVPSPVLRAMGLDSDRARCAIRISLSRYTTDEEVELAAAAFEEAVCSLRRKQETE